jgi:hypothetical protein
MSPNKGRPHVLVLPEDDANRQLANGFWLQITPERQRQLDVCHVAGGWKKVLQLFNSDHVPAMRRYPARFMVLLIDLDEDKSRLEKAKASIPEDLADRVFILSTLTQPEALRADLGPYEGIGQAMADDCREETYEICEHKLLQHNAVELGRLRESVRPILFPPF